MPLIRFWALLGASLARLKITIGRVEAVAGEGASAGLFHFGEPVIERVGTDANEGHSAFVFYAAEKIEAEEFQAAFPFRTRERAQRDAFEIGDVFFSAGALRTPAVAFRRRIEIDGGDVSAEEVAHGAVTRVAGVKHFLWLHASLPLKAVMSDEWSVIRNSRWRRTGATSPKGSTLGYKSAMAV